MILLFLKPIQHLILDDSIREVMVNGPDRVFIDPDQPPEPRVSCLCLILLHFLRLQHRVREEANL
jgi:type IV secretory pathway ATPase VirB11/archaellum biosynthesis ATPase